MSIKTTPKVPPPPYTLVVSSFPTQVIFPHLAPSTFSAALKMSGEDWVTAATEDDSLVADVLLRLRQPSPAPPSYRPPRALHVDWIVRQRRSKSVPRDVELKKKKKQPTRASPTTPLSWSGVTSASCGGTEGWEESSRLAKTFVGARSEKSVKNNNEVGRRKTKRTNRKKTLVELQEEESLLVKERRNLKSALLSLRLNWEKQKAINERLKRLKSHRKVSVPSESAPSISDQPPPSTMSENRSMITEVNQCGKINAVEQHPFPSKANLKRHRVETFGMASLLPDLNLPSGEEEASPEFLQETRRVL